MELVELLDDEEREVVVTAVQAFGDMIEHLLSGDGSDDILNQLNFQMKKMLSAQKFIEREDISRQLLANCFWCAMLIDMP